MTKICSQYLIHLSVLDQQTIDTNRGHSLKVVANVKPNWPVAGSSLHPLTIYNEFTRNLECNLDL
jgi:hypothetical protein